MKTPAIILPDLLMNQPYLMRIFVHRIQKCNLPIRYLNAEVDFTVSGAIQPDRIAYIWGPSGCGKTHLLAAMIRHLVAMDIYSQSNEHAVHDSQIAYFSIPILMAQLRRLVHNSESWPNWTDDDQRQTLSPTLVGEKFPFSNEMDVLNWMGGLDYLFLDDLGAERYTPFAEEMLYLIINRRYENLQHFTISSNLSPDEASGQLHARIITRMSEQVVELKERRNEEKGSAE